jgi:beta-hydroxylase
MKIKNWYYTPNKNDYVSIEPVIINNELYPIAQYLKSHYLNFLSEIRVLWDKPNDDLYGNFDKFDEVQFPPRSWKKVVFKIWGIEYNSNVEKFNSIKILLDKFPSITSCFVARLGPKAKVLPHSGETDAIIRFHLALNIPKCENGECSIKIFGETFNWINGEVFGFNDAFIHEAWNNTDEFRYIIIVDVLRKDSKDSYNYVTTRMNLTQVYYYLFSRVKPFFLNKILFFFFLHVLFYPTLIAYKLGNHFNFFKNIK